MRVDEEINASDRNLLDEKPKDALINNMNFDEKLGTYIIAKFSTLLQFLYCFVISTLIYHIYNHLDFLISNHYTMQNKNPVKQGHEINLLFYRVLFTGSILSFIYPLYTSLSIMFSFLATITEVEASPTTLSEVTNISIGLLIDRINE